MAREIYLNRLLIILTIGLMIGYLYFKSINFLWFGFIALTGFYMPLLYCKVKGKCWLASTLAYPILTIFYMVFALLFLSAKWGIHLTAFLPVMFDPISYQLMRFTQASNEEWLSLNFALYYFLIPILLGMSLFTWFELPIKSPIKRKLL